MIRKLSAGVRTLRNFTGTEGLDRLCSLAKHNGKDAKIVELRQFDKEKICTSELRKLCLILVKRNVVKLVGSDVYLWQRRGLSQGWHLIKLVFEKKWGMPEFNKVLSRIVQKNFKWKKYEKNL